MKYPGLAIGIGLLAAVAAAGFAGSRWLALADARTEVARREDELKGAAGLAARRPDLFGTNATATPKSSLKELVQETASRCGVTIGFVSETERDVDRNRTERQVVLRLVGASHGALVRFLGQLEAGGGGARVRDIHLRPSKVTTDVYDEAEVMLVRHVLGEGRP